MIYRDVHTHTDHFDAGSDAPGEGWPQRLERARQERNHREIARLLLDGAEATMAAADDDPDDHESLDRTQWLLARTQRSLDACGADPECLTLLCVLMERQCLLAQRWGRQGHPGRRHVACELVRDQAFDVARRAERTRDLGLRVSVILRAAEALDALGDLGDSHALRVRAFHKLGTVGEHLAGVGAGTFVSVSGSVPGADRSYQ